MKTPFREVIDQIIGSGKPPTTEAPMPKETTSTFDEALVKAFDQINHDIQEAMIADEVAPASPLEAYSMMKIHMDDLWDVLRLTDADTSQDAYESLIHVIVAASRYLLMIAVADTEGTEADAAGATGPNV